MVLYLDLPPFTMTEFLYLDIIIATLLVILVYSTIVSAFVEYLNNRDTRQKRQMYLYLSVKKALDEPNGYNWGVLVYKHPLIHSLKSKKGRYPVYIASETFAEVLISVIRDHKQTPVMAYDEKLSILKKQKPPAFSNTYKGISEAISEIEDHRFKQLLESFLTVEGSNDGEKLKSFKENIKNWFDNYQDRVNGDYKKSIRRDLLGVGITLALLFNVNLISIVDRIISDDSLRTSLVAQAEKVASDSLFTSDNFTCKDCTEEKYDEKYTKYVEKRLIVADSLAGWMSTSGLPILWKIPKTERDEVKEFMIRKMTFLEDNKEDSLDKIERRYCLVKSFFDEGTNEDTVNLLSRSLSKKERKEVSKTGINKVAKSLKLELSDQLIVDMNFLLDMSFDSTNISKCFSSSTLSKKYNECFGDCSCIDKVNFRKKLLSDMNKKIEATRLKIVTVDESDMRHWARRFIEDVIFFPADILDYNLRTWKDRWIYLIGSILMGIVSVHGATRGFELLMRLVNLRNAGLKPKGLPKK